MSCLHVLILEDRPEDAEMILYELRKAGFEFDWQRVDTEADYLAQLNPDIDIILADYTLPQFDAPRALSLLQERGWDIPFIVVTGTIGEEAAVACIKNGAVDYLLKDRMARLGPAMLNALEEKRLRDEKKRAEETLRESEARFAAFMDHLPAAAFIKDENSLIQYVNQYLKDHFDAEDWIGRRTTAYFPEQIAQRLLTGDREALAEGPSSREELLTDKDGTKRWYQIHKFPIKREGNPPLVGGIALDTTERKKMQQQLLHAGKLSAIGHLSASIIHEVNNPLQALIGLLSLALDDTTSEEDIHEYLQVAYNEVLRISRTVNRVRGFSKPVTDEMKEVVIVNDLIEQVLELTKKQCQHNDVQIVQNLDMEIPLLYAISDQIQQVFLNLIINALDAMPNGGQLRVNTAATAQPRGVRIEFQDTGTGIDLEMLPRIFDTFFTTKEKGTGLGLGISKDIVEQHGGWIQVETERGAGSTFSVWLPGVTEVMKDEDEMEYGVADPT